MVAAEEGYVVIVRLMLSRGAVDYEVALALAEDADCTAIVELPEGLM